jgi:hypothetical protein
MNKILSSLMLVGISFTLASCGSTGTSFSKSTVLPGWERPVPPTICWERQKDMTAKEVSCQT